jgi:hypothetical protein
VVSFTPRPLYPQGKSTFYLLDRRLDGPQSRSGHGGEEKNTQLLTGLELLIIQPVAQRYTSELSQLLLELGNRESHFLKYIYATSPYKTSNFQLQRCIRY